MPLPHLPVDEQRFHLKYGVSDFFSGDRCRTCGQDVAIGKVAHVLAEHPEVVTLPPLPVSP